MNTLTDIEKANEIPIQDVLKDYFDIYVPMELESAWKTFCPFGFEHSDFGLEKAFRVYPDSNSSFCFAEHGSMNNVRLLQMHEGISAKKAARKLLVHYGLMDTFDWRKHFQEIAEQRAEQTAISTASLVEALHLALSSHPAWSHLQFHPDMQEALELRLTVLEGYITDGKDAESIRAWYDYTRTDLLTLMERLADG